MNVDLQQELIEDFILESAEGLEAFNGELLALEHQGGGEETLRNIFRVIHTIKGTAGCIGLGRIEKLAHSAENLLTLVQKGKVHASPAVITTLLKVSDRLSAMVRGVEANGNDADAPIDDLLEELELATSTTQSVPVAPRQAFGLFEDDDDAPVPAAPLMLVPPTAPGAPRAIATPAAPQAETAKQSIADSAIRVDVAQLDLLMNLVGELVLTRNQILVNTASLGQDALGVAAQRLNAITSELQERVMKTRMQQIGNVWAKFPRTVRDLNADLGKRVRLVMDGQATELDRTIIEAIKDPLTHIVRNSVDHGIETPDERRAAGKPEEGLLSIRAYHEGGQVIIEIMDDGRGIDVARVKAKAVQNGLIDADRAARISDREALHLVFLPGFSTAEKVTNVSGRGVGMDVVRTNVERTGGSIDLTSEVGQGTTIRIKIPLTLAIIPALIVTSGGERFAIPQVSLVELVRLEKGHGTSVIESLYGRQVYRLRGRLLPIASLNAELRLGPDAGASASDSDVTNIIVLQTDGREFGLIVDGVNDTEEIVVKPLGKQLKDATVFAGATIMGDGRVALILDAMGIAHRAGVVEESRDRITTAAATTSTAEADKPQELLLFRLASGRRMAVPIGVATRLEEFPRTRIERAGAREVVQYRGGLLPLVRVEDIVGGPQIHDETSDSISVIVVYHERGDIGLIVHRIEDIVQQVITTRRDATGAGVLGSVVIADKVTDLLDVSLAIRSVASDSVAVAA